MICFNQIHENDKSGDRQNAFWRAESNHQLFVRSQYRGARRPPRPLFRIQKNDDDDDDDEKETTDRRRLR